MRGHVRVRAVYGLTEAVLLAPVEVKLAKARALHELADAQLELLGEISTGSSPPCAQLLAALSHCHARLIAVGEVVEPSMLSSPMRATTAIDGVGVGADGSVAAAGAGVQAVGRAIR